MSDSVSPEPQKRKAWNKGISPSEETRAKIREARKRQVFTEETRHKLSEARKNRECPPETRLKISLAQKDKPRWTDEDKAHMSLTRKGKPQSPELVAKRTEATRIAMQRPEVKINMSVARKGHKKSPAWHEKQAMMRARRGKRVVSETTREKLRNVEHSEEWYEKITIANRANWEAKSPKEKQAQIERIRKAVPTGKGYQSKIEDAYAQFLDSQGIIYQRQVKIGWYLVDFYIETENRIIEVNGCYWHNCIPCGYADAHKGKREADQKRYEYLRRKGYLVEIIWEHDLLRKLYSK